MKRHMHNTLRGFFGVMAVALLGEVLLAGVAQGLTYQTTVGVDFTINPTLTVTLSSADLLIESLTPGSSANSNEITVTVTTNAAYGYTLSATTGSASNATRNLVPESGSANFASIDFYNADVKGSQTSLPDNTSDTNSGTWGFSVDSGSHYNGLPLYTDTTNVATLLSSNSMPASGSVSTPFLIGAKASSTQAVGEYTNVVNFVAVAQANWQASEVACPANYICYVPNADNGAIEGSMNYIATYSGDTTSKKGYQSASKNASVTLVAPNYKRDGY
ncbi:hypothetical protein IJJ49_01960, partial [Candidatus Saccharibacteria bacterium]|nr:hypothetical protein [Candidatus Saccharibacteria bacterium]